MKFTLGFEEPQPKSHANFNSFIGPSKLLFCCNLAENVRIYVTKLDFNFFSACLV